MRFGHQLRQRLVECDADRHWIGAGARNAQHFQSRRDLRFPPPPAHTLREVEHTVDAIRGETIEHLCAPAEANGIVAAGAECGFEGFDRFERVELFETVAGRSFRFQVVGQTDPHPGLRHPERSEGSRR